MTNKFKKTIKLGLLILGVSLCVTNCNKSDDVYFPNQTKEGVNNAVDFISPSDFESINYFEKLKTEILPAKNNNILSKNLSEIIQYEFINKPVLVATGENKTSYTASVKKIGDTSNSFDTKLLIQEVDNQVYYFLIQESKVYGETIITDLNPSKTTFIENKSNTGKSGNVVCGPVELVVTEVTSVGCCGAFEGQPTSVKTTGITKTICRRTNSPKINITPSSFDTPTYGVNNPFSDGSSDGSSTSPPPVYVYEGEESCDGHGNCTPPLYWTSIISEVNPSSNELIEILNTISIDYNGLTDSQKEWVLNKENIDKINELLNFLSENGNSEEAKTEAKMRITAEMVNDTDPTMLKWDFTKKGIYLDRESLKYKATSDVPGTFGTEKMYLLENDLILYVASGNKKINNDDVSLPSSEPSDEGYHYIYSSETKKYYEYRLPPATYVGADIDFLIEGFWTGTKIFARYATPIEDAIILIDGKDFDGVEQGKVQTAGFMILGFVPGGKLLKPVSKVIKNSDTALAGWKIIAKIGDDTVALSFKVINGTVNFGQRTKLARIIKTTPLEEAHHILPWNKLGNEVIQEAAYAGFHMNSKINGKALQKFTRLTGEGLHGNHPAYDKYVQKRLEDFATNVYNSEEAKDFLQKKLIPKLDELIELAKSSDLNLNEYFKQVVNPQLGI